MLRLIAPTLLLLASTLAGCDLPPSHHVATNYRSPETGSMLGAPEDDSQNLTNGYHDPGMGGHATAAGGN